VRRRLRKRSWSNRFFPIRCNQGQTQTRLSARIRLYDKRNRSSRRKKLTLKIVQALNDRGVIGALAVLKALSSEQLERGKDVIEYWDEIRGSKGPGLLINLIKTNEPLPRTFESSREKKRRQLETERRQRLRDAREFLDYADSEYQKEAVDQYINQTLSEQEYSQRVEVEKEKIKPEAGSWMRNPSPELIEHLAERAIRTEIASLWIGMGLCGLPDGRPFFDTFRLSYLAGCQIVCCHSDRKCAEPATNRWNNYDCVGKFTKRELSKIQLLAAIQPIFDAQGEVTYDYRLRCACTRL